jgi:hypothetical protein
MKAALCKQFGGPEGITLEEYQEIGRTARDDPALAARINDIYEAKAGD